MSIGVPIKVLHEVGMVASSYCNINSILDGDFAKAIFNIDCNFANISDFICRQKATSLLARQLPEKSTEES